MNKTPEPLRSKSGRNGAVTALTLLTTMFVAVATLHAEEAETSGSYIQPDTAQAGENRIDAAVKIVSADPVKGDVVVRIDFTPRGALTSDAGATINRDVELFVSSATGKQVHEFKKGKRITPVEAVLDIYDGDAMDYPFDEHQAQLALYFDPTAPAGAATAEDADDEIPVAVELFGTVSGLDISAEKSKESAVDYPVIDITIQRAGTARFFSIFIMVAMWLLTIAVVFLVIHVLTGRRKIEIGMFSFLGALLFAFPALRNSQPGTPAIGTYSDFLAFFWAEVLIALCLLTILSIWLVRGAERPGSNAADARLH